MAKISQLEQNGETVYPITKLNAVLDNNNKNVGELLENRVEKTNDASKVYATDESGKQTTLDYSQTWTDATVNTSNWNGSCKYIKIGKLVCVYIRGFTTASCPDHRGVLFSDLPIPELSGTASNEIVFCLNNSNFIKPTSLRVFFDDDSGELKTCYTTASVYNNESLDQMFFYLSK